MNGVNGIAKATQEVAKATRTGIEATKQQMIHETLKIFEVLGVV